jgi:hypothetical protein
MTERWAGGTIRTATAVRGSGPDTGLVVLGQVSLAGEGSTPSPRRASLVDPALAAVSMAVLGRTAGRDRRTADRADRVTSALGAGACGDAAVGPSGATCARRR